MLAQGPVAESPQDQVVDGIVPGVLDVQILEQKGIRPKDAVRPGTHLMATTDHATCPAVASTR